MTYNDIVTLGIESTAHTFGVGVASSKGKIYANINDSYIPKNGGIHPRLAAEHHAKVAPLLIKKALEISNISLKDINGIAVALGPGLGPCLRVGATVARYLALKYSKPLIPVNHAVAHIEIARLTTGALDPLIVYVSGGNTIISSYLDEKYRIIGETLDIAIGNFFDTFARKLNLGFPGTPKVEELAKKGKKIIELPYTIKGNDLLFSGLLTAALRSTKENNLEDVCLSIVEIAYDMLVEATERALVHLMKKEIILTGGVARSEYLVKKLKNMIRLHNAVLGVVPKEYAGDNGAMIAYTGALELLYNITIPVEKSTINQSWRLDESYIPWYYNFPSKSLRSSNE